MGQILLNKCLIIFIAFTTHYLSTYYIGKQTHTQAILATYIIVKWSVVYSEVCYLAGWLLCVQIHHSLQQHSIVLLVIQAQFHSCIHIPAGDDHWPSLTCSECLTRQAAVSTLLTCFEAHTKWQQPDVTFLPPVTHTHTCTHTHIHTYTHNIWNERPCWILFPGLY